jgi:type I restriction enzyme S subunit
MIATAVENKKTAWLGEFPAHWEVLRIKNLFQEMDSRSETGSEELLSVSHYTGVTLKRESLENEDDHLTNAESLVGYKLVQQGDLVINIMLAWNGSLGISPYNGITSPAYCVYRVKGDNNPEYFGYLFTTNLFKAEFRRHSTGIIDSRLRLYSDKFFSIFTVVPPKHEQDEIVQYIKAQEEKINLFIQKKQRFIELLKEQRQGIINEAITKGGKNWKTYRLKTIVGSSTNGVWGDEPKDNDEDIYCIRVADIDSLTYGISENKLTIRNIETSDQEGRLLNTGDLIIEKSGGGDVSPVGRVVIYNLPHKAVTSNFMARLNISMEINNEFLYYIFSFLYSGRRNVPSIKATTGIQNIDLYSYLQNKVLVPPIEEQQQIVSHIKTETATIDTAIAKAEREIELIREYKEAMIAEAVMGKRK